VNVSLQQQSPHHVQQDDGPTKSQSKTDTNDDKVKSYKSLRQQQESESSSPLRRKRVLNVAAHRIILTEPVAPRETPVAQPILFEWPDSAAASRATAAASAVWSGTMQQQLQHLVQPTSQKAGVCNGRDERGYRGNDLEKAAEFLSPGSAASSSSLFPVQRRRVSSLPPRAQTVPSQISGDSCWHSSAIRGMSCKAEIVMAGSTEPAGHATPVSVGQSRRNLKDKSRQESPAYDASCTTSISRPQELVIGLEEQAESFTAKQETPHQLKSCSPKSCKLPEIQGTVTGEHSTRRFHIVSGPPGFAQATRGRNISSGAI